jgi:hypothetical protein
MVFYLFFLQWAQANAMPMQFSLFNEMNEQSERKIASKYHSSHSIVIQRYLLGDNHRISFPLFRPFAQIAIASHFHPIA